MADPGTAMRDIIFYRWHAFMNEVFDRHKRTLVPYTPTTVIKLNLKAFPQLIYPNMIRILGRTSFTLARNQHSRAERNTFDWWHG